MDGEELAHILLLVILDIIKNMFLYRHCKKRGDLNIVDFVIFYYILESREGYCKTMVTVYCILCTLYMLYVKDATVQCYMCPDHRPTLQSFWMILHYPVTQTLLLCLTAPTQGPIFNLLNLQVIESSGVSFWVNSLLHWGRYQKQTSRLVIFSITFIDG